MPPGALRPLDAPGALRAAPPALASLLSSLFTYSFTALTIKDKFAVFASGSTSAVDGGIIISKQADGAGFALGYDSGTSRWGLDNDLAIVINIHHFEEIFSDPLAFKQKLLSLWEQIARHFKDYPDDIIFEMLNEPHQKLTSEIWNEFIAEGISLIRKIDDKRTLMIGPANWNSINSLNTLEIPNDENLIITVHYYSPFEFTHQGASWVENSDRWMGTTWDATNTQKELIDKDIAIVKEWGIRNNRPIFIGEFGAYSKADFNSRFRWTEYMVQVMQKNEISWSYWEFCSGFGAWDQETKKWNELLYALIQPN